MRTHLTRRPRGFTLVELLVASIILGLGLVALSQLYLAAMWTYQKARYMSLATQRAQLEFEQVQGFGFEKLNVDPLVVTDNTKYPDAEYDALTTDRGVQFTIEEMEPVHGIGTVKFSHYEGHPELLQAVIEITWGASPRTRTLVKVTTLVSKPPSGGG